jgi:hypothetical protein
MNFTIRKNTTLPALKYDITHLVANDSLLGQKLKSGVITFSMIDKVTGEYVVANKTGGLSVEKPATHEVGLLNGLRYFLIFKWSRKDTSRIGEYKGEFRLDILDGSEDSMAFPDNSESINISIVATLTATNNETLTPAPVTTTPILSGVTEHTYSELKALRNVGGLKSGTYYLLKDFQTIHVLKSECNGNDAILGEIEPLLLFATATDKFDPIAKSTVYESDVIHYNFDAVSEPSSLLLHNKGLITYREDVVNKLIAHFDWRLGLSVDCGVQKVHTFGPNCKNITLGAGSKHIFIGADSSDIIIGQSCSDIILPKKSNAINIGNSVEGVDFSDFDGNPYTNQNLTIFNNSMGGQLFMEIELQRQSIYEVGVYPVGILPKRMMPINYSLSVFEVHGNGSRISFGVESIIDDLLLPETSVSELTDSHLYNTVFMDVSENEEYIVMYIKGVDLVIPNENSMIRLNLNFIKV